MFNYWIPLFGLLLAFNCLADWRDPTAPGNLTTPPPQAVNMPTAAPLNLSAILIADTGKRAIINGVTLAAGQNLDDDTRLLKILPGHVVIRQRDTVMTLHLVPSVKKPLK